MTIASTFAPDHVIAQTASKFKEKIESETDGSFSVSLSPGGSYGSINKISQTVSSGGLEAHGAGPKPFLEHASEYYFFSSPLVLDSYDQSVRLMESDVMQPAIDQIREDGNQVPVGDPIYRGARQLAVKESVGVASSPADIAGIKMRLPEEPPWVKIWESIGVDPTSVAWTEVYTALQTGVASAVEAPPGALQSSKLNEVTDVINVTSHLYSIGSLYFNSEFYDGLDKTYRELVDELSAEAAQEASEEAKENEESILDEFESAGLTINRDVDQAAFKEAARPAIEELFENEWASSWDEVKSV